MYPFFHLATCRFLDSSMSSVPTPSKNALTAPAQARARAQAWAQTWARGGGGDGGGGGGGYRGGGGGGDSGYSLHCPSIEKE